jgi:hypothetical protein
MFTFPPLDPYLVFLELAFAKALFKDRVVRTRRGVDSTKVGVHSRWLRGLDTKI